MALLAICSLCLVSPIAIAVLVFHRLASGPSSGLPAEQWDEEFSLDQYRPMERLLSERDFEFLARQPGYRPGIGRELRAARRRIFSEYLRLMVEDFNRLLRRAKLMAVLAPEDRGEFARALFKQQVSFYALVGRVRFRLALGRFGVAPSNPRALIRALEQLCEKIERPLAAPLLQ
jgi:hypothetical protein